MTRPDTGHLLFSGELDPDEITAQLGLEPSWIKRLGDPGPPDAVGIRTAAVWCLEAQEESTGDVADQLIDILVPLRGKATVVAELASRFHSKLQVTAFLDGNHPGWFLSAELVRELATLGVDFECVNLHSEEASTLQEKTIAY